MKPFLRNHSIISFIRDCAWKWQAHSLPWIICGSCSQNIITTQLDLHLPLFCQFFTFHAAAKHFGYSMKARRRMIRHWIRTGDDSAFFHLVLLKALIK